MYSENKKVIKELKDAIDKITVADESDKYEVAFKLHNSFSYETNMLISEKAVLYFYPDILKKALEVARYELI